MCNVIRENTTCDSQTSTIKIYFYIKKKNLREKMKRKMSFEEETTLFVLQILSLVKLFSYL